MLWMIEIGVSGIFDRVLGAKVLIHANHKNVFDSYLLGDLMREMRLTATGAASDSDDERAILTWDMTLVGMIHFLLRSPCL